MIDGTYRGEQPSVEWFAEFGRRWRAAETFDELIAVLRESLDELEARPERPHATIASGEL